MRLIDADALIEAMEERKKIWLSKCEYNDAIRKVKEAPTIERPRGEWKVCSYCSDGFKYKCSLCERVVNEGHWFEQKEILSVYPYCHCGAKMIAVEDPIAWYSSLGKVSEADLKHIKVGNTIYTQDDDKQGWTGRERRIK